MAMVCFLSTPIHSCFTSFEQNSAIIIDKVSRPIWDALKTNEICRYFEIFFYDYRIRSSQESCGHRIHRDMIRCFAFDNLIATVQYALASPYEVSLMHHVHIPPQLSTRIARLELSRLVSFADTARTAAIRNINRSIPAIVIDSASDVLRDRIVREHERLVQSAAKLANESVGPTRARQLYLDLFRETTAWRAQVRSNSSRICDIAMSSQLGAFERAEASAFEYTSITYTSRRPTSACFGVWKMEPSFYVRWTYCADYYDSGDYDPFLKRFLKLTLFYDRFPRK